MAEQFSLMRPRIMCKIKGMKTASNRSRELDHDAFVTLFLAAEGTQYGGIGASSGIALAPPIWRKLEAGGRERFARRGPRNASKTRTQEALCGILRREKYQARKLPDEAGCEAKILMARKEKFSQAGARIAETNPSVPSTGTRARAVSAVGLICDNQAYGRVTPRR